MSRRRLEIHFDDDVRIAHASAELICTQVDCKLEDLRAKARCHEHHLGQYHGQRLDECQHAVEHEQLGSADGQLVIREAPHAHHGARRLPERRNGRLQEGEHGVQREQVRPAPVKREERHEGIEGSEPQADHRAGDGLEARRAEHEWNGEPRAEAHGQCEAQE
jgi:hypothetical protein